MSESRWWTTHEAARVHHAADGVDIPREQLNRFRPRPFAHKLVCDEYHNCGKIFAVSRCRALISSSATSKEMTCSASNAPSAPAKVLSNQLEVLDEEWP